MTHLIGMSASQIRLTSSYSPPVRRKRVSTGWIATFGKCLLCEDVRVLGFCLDYHLDPRIQDTGTGVSVLIDGEGRLLPDNVLRGTVEFVVAGSLGPAVSIVQL